MTQLPETLQSAEGYISRGEYALALAALASIPQPTAMELEMLPAALERLAHLTRACRAHHADELERLLGQVKYSHAPQQSSWQMEG